MPEKYNTKLKDNYKYKAIPYSSGDSPNFGSEFSDPILSYVLTYFCCVKINNIKLYKNEKIKSAVVSIIKSCIPGIKDPWQMPSVDIDASLIAIRAATNGTDLEVESKCPKCEEESKYGVNLIGLLGKMSVGNYDNMLNSGELKIKLKPMNYTDINQGNLAQFEMQRDISSIESIVDQDERNEKSRTTMLKISKMNIDMMMNSIEFIMIPTGEQVIDKAFIGEFLENCDRNVHDLIRKSITSLRENTIIKPQQIKCIHCTYDYDQPLILNVTDFFA